MLTGRQEIWGRQDPPDPQLALLSVLGDARDASCAFRFPIAVDGIVPGFGVRRGPFRQVEAYQATGKVIRLGKVTGTGGDVAVPLQSLTKHALIAGSTGSGKTTTALEILRQLWVDHGIPFLVIEPVNSDTSDYRKLADEPGFELLEVITVGDEASAPLRFNPFEVPTGVLVGEHTANLLTCFTVAFGLFEPLSSIYQDALNLTYLRAGFLSAERPTGANRTWPTVVEFLAAMGEATKGLGYAGAMRARIDAFSIRRAQQLTRGFSGSAFLTDRPNDIGRLLDRPVIIELKSLGAGDEQTLMMALLLNAITEHYQSVRGPSPDLVHVTLVEEAHRLLARAAGGKPAQDAQAKEKAAEAFANVLAENGKYGDSVIIAEQSPTKLVANAVKNANLKIVHRLTAEDDRRYLGETMGMDAAQRLLAARLQAGEALLYSDAFAEAAQVSVAKTPRAAAPRPGLVQPSATPPFAACDRCRAQCAYRGAALSMMNDPGIVKGITDTAGALTQAGSTPAEQRAGLAGLRGRLYDTVGRFTVLPAADPGRSDAAFCLFLHIYASSALRAAPAWPAIAATLLQISDAQAGAGTAAGKAGRSRRRSPPGGRGHRGTDRDGRKRAGRPEPDYRRPASARPARQVRSVQSLGGRVATGIGRAVMSFCASCGRQRSGTARFCGTCGTEFSDSPAAPDDQESPPADAASLNPLPDLTRIQPPADQPDPFASWYQQKPQAVGNEKRDDLAADSDSERQPDPGGGIFAVWVYLR